MSQSFLGDVTFGRVRASDLWVGRTKHMAGILLTLFCVSSFTHAQRITLIAPEIPAGCHSHGHPPKLPSQQPVSYVCCAAGHTCALVLPSYFPQLLLLGAVCDVPVSPLSPLKIVCPKNYLFATTGSPPGSSPLRV